MKNPKTILTDTEFMNGLLLICAAGIGGSLKVPDTWPSGQMYTHSDNALLFDFRELSLNELVMADVHLVGSTEVKLKTISPVFELRTPTMQMYVGDAAKKQCKIISTKSPHCKVAIGSLLEDNKLHLYIISRELSLEANVPK